MYVRVQRTPANLGWNGKVAKVTHTGDYNSTPILRTKWLVDNPTDHTDCILHVGEYDVISEKEYFISVLRGELL